MVDAARPVEAALPEAGQAGADGRHRVGIHDVQDYRDASAATSRASELLAGPVAPGGFIHIASMLRRPASRQGLAAEVDHPSMMMIPFSTVTR